MMMKFTFKIGVVLSVLFSVLHSFSQINPKEIKYWVGSGADTAYLAVNFFDQWNENTHVWGYLYDGTKTIDDLIGDVNTADGSVTFTKAAEIENITKGWVSKDNSDNSSWNIFTSDLQITNWAAGLVLTNELIAGTVYGVAFDADELTGGEAPTPTNSLVLMESPLYHDESIQKVKFFIGEGELSTVILVDFKNEYFKESITFGVKFSEGETLSDILTNLQQAYEDFSYKVDDNGYLSGITFDTLSAIAPDQYFSLLSNDLSDDLGSYDNTGLSQTLDANFYYSFVISGGHTPSKIRPVFSPADNENGSIAISKDSTLITAWASNVAVSRGFVQVNDESITDKESNKSTYGTTKNAIGVASGTSTDVISLGDAGVALLTFNTPIENEEGPDFAVFENGFGSTYLELAFVEVSSDGLNFHRFPSVSLTDVSEQIGGFGQIDPKNLYNLAGSFKQGYGTPFDLEELKNIDGLDIDNITHVKIIDVVGTINPQFASKDSEGNIVNDPYPTPYWSSGFDLDGVAVLNENTVSDLSTINESTISVYPNPARSTVNISLKEDALVSIYDINGTLIYSEDLNEGVNMLASESIGLTSGMYFVQTAEGSVSKLIIR